MHRSSLGRRLVAEQAEDSVRVLGRNPGSQISLKLGEQQWLAFRSTSWMADRIFDRDFLGRTAIREKNLNGISNRAFSRIEIITGKTGVFFDFHLGTQLVDQRIFSRFIFIILSGQAAPDERYGDHVLDAMITISRIEKWAALIDDALTGFLGFNEDSTDLVQPAGDFGVKLERRFHGGLSMKFCWERNLEKHVSHDIRAERLSECDWLPAVNDVLKPPFVCG